MKIFAVYDSKAEAYLQPFFARTDGVALRMFGQAAQDEQHDFSKHAADYTLFCLGEFDEYTGKIAPLDALYNLGNALSLRPEIMGGE